MAHSKKKKSEAVPEKDLIANTLDKNSKTVLKQAQRLKEDAERVKKMTCEQNENINKKKFRSGNYNDCNEKFTRGIKKQI